MTRFGLGGVGFVALILSVALVVQPVGAATPFPAAAGLMVVGTVINVPADVPTIQAGVDLAANGDVVLVAPGTYNENVYIAGKTITLASNYYLTGDPADIDATVIDGGGIVGPESVVEFASSVGPETTIIGFHVQNIGVVPDGERLGDGIMASAPVNILYNHVTDSFDGLEYKTTTGGLAKGNLLEGNIDDGIDLNRQTNLVAEQNEIRFNGGDGIEMRMQDYTGPNLLVVFRDNYIHDNEDDGIQLIDYDGLSSRTIVIERNLIVNNDQAGVGIMGNGITVENYEGYGALEPVFVTNNTFIGNNHGLTGGHNLTARNNIFVNHVVYGVKNVDGDSTLTHNLFWNNGTDQSSSNIDIGTTVFADPLLDGTYHLLASSPAIDAGVDVGMAFNGSAPDLGAYETPGVPPPPNAAPVANDDTATTLKATAVVVAVSSNDTDPDGNLDPTSVNVACGTCTTPANGSVTNPGTGTIIYTPSGSFVGVDTFIYEICDTGPLCDTATATITVTTPPAVNAAPTVIITGPADGTALPEGIILVLTGTAADAEDGSLTGALKWSSSIDGPLPGAGGSISVLLSAGTHVISARVTDTGGKSGEASITVDVQGASTPPPSGSGMFTDDDDSPFEVSIEWLAAQGITKGCNPPENTMFCPDRPVTRGQMAGFLVRAFGYTDDGGGHRFVDTDGTTFESSIDKLAAAGITKGCNPPENTMFCPDLPVTRGQMAGFLVRAFGYTDDGGGDLFVDDDDSIFRTAIDRLGTAGVIRGCNPPENDRFCPDALVTRGEMAAFIRRAMTG